MVSSSGGIFPLIASLFDVIYGVSMSDDNRTAVYKRCEGNITPLLGSKYMQAKIGDTFRQIKEDLNIGKKVLFVGMACQISGLLSFLQKKYENLLTVDIICHGVPTPKYWQKYIEKKINELEEEYKKKEKDIINE